MACFISNDVKDFLKDLRSFCREYPVEKLLRDDKIFQIFAGPNEIQRLVIGRSTIGKI